MVMRLQKASGTAKKTKYMFQPSERAMGSLAIAAMKMVQVKTVMLEKRIQRTRDASNSLVSAGSWGESQQMNWK
jgi:hypothetical protein